MATPLDAIQPCSIGFINCSRNPVNGRGGDFKNCSREIFLFSSFYERRFVRGFLLIVTSVVPALGDRAVSVCPSVGSRLMTSLVLTVLLALVSQRHTVSASKLRGVSLRQGALHLPRECDTPYINMRQESPVQCAIGNHRRISLTVDCG